MFQNFEFLISGVQGKVYTCLYDNQPAITKVFFDIKVLRREYKVLKTLGETGMTNCPRLIKTVKHDGLYGIVTDRLGPPLDYTHTYSTQGTNQIGIQLVTLLEQVHKAGYTYGDLKPDNILVGEYG